MRKLRNYQQEGIDFLLANPKCGLFFDCGLGKTITVLTAIEQHQLGPALVVAPLRVARLVWPREIEDWDVQLSCSVVHGRKRQEALDARSDLTVVNPEGLGHVIDWINANEEVPWKTLIVDESTYFKNVKSQRWKRLRAIADYVERVVLLTGTPIAGRGHIDLWAQFDLLGENPLGSWPEFTTKFFTFDHFNRPNLNWNADKTINSLVAPHVLRRDLEHVDMPDLTELNVQVEMPMKARKTYAAIGIEENSYSPLRCMASGFTYDHHWSGNIEIPWHHTEKLSALEEIAETGENLLVFSCFTAEIDAICKQFDAPFIDGRTNPLQSEGLVTEWNAGVLPMLVMHPRSGGHGLNLQHGGHRIVWMSLPDSGELYTQANARLYRAGQRSGKVVIHKMICADTIDVVINNLLKNKCLNESNLLRTIKNEAPAGSAG